jgi:hypothetical protein
MGFLSAGLTGVGMASRIEPHGTKIGSVMFNSVGIGGNGRPEADATQFETPQSDFEQLTNAQVRVNVIGQCPERQNPFRGVWRGRRESLVGLVSVFQPNTPFNTLCFSRVGSRENSH